MPIHLPAGLWAWISKSAKIAELVLAIIAVLFAARQFWDAHVQAKILEDIGTHTKTLDNIGENARLAVQAASTRSIPTFPDSLHEITDIVRRTCAEMTILVDVAAYGHYSAPDEFNSYYLALQEIASMRLDESRKTKTCSDRLSDRPSTDRVRIRALIYNPVLTQQSLATQFQKDSRTLVKEPRFAKYFDYHKNLNKPSSKEELISILRDQDFAVARQFQSMGAEVRVADHRFPIYFWLRDGEDAVFVFNYQAPETGAATEIPFRTHDGKLTNVFAGIFESEWTNGKPLDDALAQIDPARSHK